MRTRPALPAGHGELLTRPDFDRWPALARANHDAAAAWDFEVGGVPVGDLRSAARREDLAAAEAFCERLGIEHAPAGDPDGLLVVTGHQPEIYHTGVWVKDFLLQAVARETGATALDVVVDTDGFDAVEITAPCMTPDVQRCREYLALGTPESAYVLAAVPSDDELATFQAAGEQMLSSLPAPAVVRHFSAFAQGLRDVAPRTRTLAELVTTARRRYERTAGTDYLELPASEFGSTFAHVVASLALDAERFSAAYNQELTEYRAITKTRSAAQPFPDLAAQDGTFELPFWYLSGHRRTALWARPLADGGARLEADGEPIAILPPDARAAGEIVAGLPDGFIGPKAVALTLYLRVFVADLFIHGVGGGRYDRVTDGLIRRYFGVEAPPFAVASLTMYLPLGAHVVTDDEIAEAKDRVNRLEHNPDALLGEVDFDSEREREQALALAAEKRELVAAIAAPDADKKTLGARIRVVNADLSALLAPVRDAFTAELASLEAQRAATGILTDRTYPFCFWSPSEIADKVG